MLRNHSPAAIVQVFEEWNNRKAENFFTHSKYNINTEITVSR